MKKKTSEEVVRETTLGGESSTGSVPESDMFDSGELEVHTLALLVPEMKPDDFQMLKESIGRDGLTLAITLYEGKVLDGRHRYRACMELGMVPRFEEYSGDSPATYVYTMNFPRREISYADRLRLASKMLPELQREAAQRQATGTLASPDAKGKATQRAAAMTGVSQASLERIQYAEQEAEEHEAAGRHGHAEAIREALAKSPNAGAREARARSVESPEYRTALERIGVILGEKVRKAVENGVLQQLDQGDVVYWAELKDAEMREIVEFVVGSRWKPNRAVRLIRRSIDEKTTIVDLKHRCIGAGGTFNCRVGGFIITVEHPMDLGC